MSESARLAMPRSVAVVGASELGGKNYYGARVLRNLLDSATDMQLFTVNPKYAGGEIMGVPAFGSLAELPESPDLVVIAIPAAAVIQVLEEAGAAGAKTCVVLTRESGGSRAREEFAERVRRISEHFGMRVIGPNSMGVLCGTAMLNASFASGAHDGALRPGVVSMISQSGSSISYLLQLFRDTPVGYRWLFSTGDEAASSLETLFEDVVEDSHTRVIVLFVEGVSDGIRFRRAALRARLLGKPVLMLQVGVSTLGREAVQTHTGRLAGVEKAFDAVAKESGIIAVRTFERLYDLVAALHEQALPRLDQSHRRRALVVTTSGGAGAYTADRLSELGWSLPPVSDAGRREIERITGQGDLQNPIDVTGTWGNPQLLADLLVAASEHVEADAVLLATGAGGKLAQPVAKVLAAVRPQLTQEFYTGWVAMAPEVAGILAAGGVTAFPDPERAARAAEASARVRQNQQVLQPTADVLELLTQIRPGTHHAGSQTRGEQRTWTAGETLASLSAAGVRCADSRLSSGLEVGEVTTHADEIGFPVAVKIESPSLSHKSDIGGVVIGIQDAHQLAREVGALAQIAGEARLVGSRILVQEMVEGIQVLIGLKRDRAFGLLLIIGVGGVHAELHPDVRAVALPATREQLAGAVASHPVLDRLLDGYRGAAPTDRDDLVRTIELIAAWGLAQGEALQEADINPLMVGSSGAVAVDARAVVQEVIAR